MTSDDQKEMIRLLELDYEKTTKLAEGVISNGFTIRGWAITLTSALIGFSIQARLWPMAVLASALALLFALIDGYYSWLYARASAQAGAIEEVLRAYYGSLARGDDDTEAQHEFEALLLAHQFGRFSQTQRFTLLSLRDVRPRFVFVVMYVTLLLCGFAGAVFVARMAQSPTPKLECAQVPGQATFFTCTTKP